LRRLRTRLFAAQCILELPSDVGSDARHFDLVAAQATPGTPAGAEKSFGAHSHACADVGNYMADCTVLQCDKKAFKQPRKFHSHRSCNGRRDLLRHKFWPKP
jgi:hypothetical protein